MTTPPEPSQGENPRDYMKRCTDLLKDSEPNQAERTRVCLDCIRRFLARGKRL